MILHQISIYFKFQFSNFVFGADGGIKSCISYLFFRSGEVHKDEFRAIKNVFCFADTTLSLFQIDF